METSNSEVEGLVQEIFDEYTNYWNSSLRVKKHRVGLTKEELTTILTTHGAKEYERGREEERERIKDQYGSYDNGCGCCSTTDLRTELTSEDHPQTDVTKN